MEFRFRHIEQPLVFPVLALNLAIVLGGGNPNAAISNPQFLQRLFKQRPLGFLFDKQRVGKFRAVVCLDLLDGKRKLVV